MTPIIEASALSYKSGHTYLLRDIHWQVAPGEHWIIYGLNGSGKTTLLSIVAGYLRQTHGSLRLFGTAYDDDNILELRRRVGWVSSSFFDKHLQNESAQNIVLSGLSGSLGICGGITDDDVSRTHALLERFGLVRKRDHPFSLLSKGERQNVLIARALLARPEILIMDEPTTGLDLLAAERLLDITRTLAAETGITLLYVTHTAEEILPLFSRALLLKSGRIFAKGATEDLFNSETLSRFFGQPVACQRGSIGYALHTVKGGATHGHQS